MRFTFCQIDNALINPPQGTIAERFYDTFWRDKKADGYWRPSFAWELPLWIAEISYTLPANVKRELLVVKEQGINLVPNSIYCFSVLDVNAGIIRTIIENNQQCRFILGGY